MPWTRRWTGSEKNLGMRQYGAAHNSWTIWTKMSVFMFRIVLLISLLTASCAQANLVKFTARPPAAPQHRLEYEQGLIAFQEFTPQGYTRALEHFRKAFELSPDTCEYALQIAQTNLFLAQEQRSNYEDFSTTLQDGAPPACGT